MAENFIDVDYEVISSDNDDSEKNQGSDITINADPVSSAISGLANIANHITDSVKEYNMCKQQEKTKREAIKAQMKMEIERIHVQKDMCMELLESQHQENMQLIESNYNKFKQVMNMTSNAVQSAIKVAEKSGDFSGVCNLLELNCKLIQMLSDAEIKQMQARTNFLEKQNPVAGFLK